METSDLTMTEDTKMAPAEQEQILQPVLQAPQCKVTEILPLVLQALSNSNNPEVRYFRDKLQEDLEPAAEALDGLLKAFAALPGTISNSNVDIDDETKALHAEILEGDQSICEFLESRLAETLTFCYGHLGILSSNSRRNRLTKRERSRRGVLQEDIARLRFVRDQVESIFQGKTDRTLQVGRAQPSSGVRPIATLAQDHPQPPPPKRAKLTEHTTTTTPGPTAQLSPTNTPALHILRAAGIHPTHPPLNAHLAHLLPHKLGDVPKPFRREVDHLRRIGELKYSDDLEESLRVGALVDGHCTSGIRSAAGDGGGGAGVDCGITAGPAGTRLAVYQDVMVRMMEGWWAAKDEAEANAKKQQSSVPERIGDGRQEVVPGNSMTQTGQGGQQDEPSVQTMGLPEPEAKVDSCEAGGKSVPSDNRQAEAESHVDEQILRPAIDDGEAQAAIACGEEEEAPVAEEEDAPGEEDTKMDLEVD
jgi:hypothetical protein